MNYLWLCLLGYVWPFPNLGELIQRLQSPVSWKPSIFLLLKGSKSRIQGVLAKEFLHWLLYLRRLVYS